MQKIILLLLLTLSLTGCDKPLLGGKGEVDLIISDDILEKSILSEQYIKSSIQEEEELFRKDNKGYKKITEKEYDGIKYKVDEYKVWDGKETPKETGYITTYTKKDGSTKVEATGSLSDELSHDWEQIISTSTSK